MIPNLFLTLIVSCDMFLTAAAYGVSGIRISISAAGILSITSAVILMAGMLAAQLCGMWLPLAWCRYAGCLLLATLGVISVLRSLGKQKLPQPPTKEDTGSPHFLAICLDAVAADADGSQNLSGKEAAFLAVALSLDAAAAGFGSGLQNNGHPIRCGMLCLGIGFLSVVTGQFLGRRCFRKATTRLDWLTGVLLILLALLQLRV
jgi:putative sporulation protein YtaF